MIALLGGVAGLGVAHLAVNALVGVRPPIPVPLNLDFPLDARVLGFTVGASLVAGILFGLVPALQATNPRIASTLRDESGTVTRSGRMRSTLVVAQVASHVLGGLPPIAVGFFLERALEGATDRLGVYHGFFALAALLRARLLVPPPQEERTFRCHRLFHHLPKAPR